MPAPHALSSAAWVPAQAPVAPPHWSSGVRGGRRCSLHHSPLRGQKGHTQLPPQRTRAGASLWQRGQQQQQEPKQQRGPQLSLSERVSQAAAVRLAAMQAKKAADAQVGRLQRSLPDAAHAEAPLVCKGWAARSWPAVRAHLRWLPRPITAANGSSAASPAPCALPWYCWASRLHMSSGGEGRLTLGITCDTPVCCSGAASRSAGRAPGSSQGWPCWQHGSRCCRRAGQGEPGTLK